MQKLERPVSFKSSLVKKCLANTSQELSQLSLPWWDSQVVPLSKLKGLRPLPPTRRIPGFLIFGFFEKCWFLEFFRWDLGSGRVCNRLEMAVGFKWTDSQLISSLLTPFFRLFSWFRWFCYCFRWSDVVSWGSQDLLRVPWRSRDPVWRSRGPVRICHGGQMLLPEGPRTLRNCLEAPGTVVSALPNWSGLVWTCWNMSQLVGTCRN